MPVERKVFGILGMTAPTGQSERVASGYSNPERVRFMNSVISPEKPHRKRFKDAADSIVKGVSEGPLDVVLCSMGSTEWMYINKIIQKKYPDFFDNPQTKERLRFFINAESGANRTLKERMKYIREIVRMVRNPGLDVMYAFPTDASPEDVSTVFSAISNKGEGFTVVPLPESLSNREFVPEELWPMQERYNNEFRSAIEEKDVAAATRIRDERGRAFREPMLQIFDGAPHLDDPSRPKLKLSIMGLRVVIRAFGDKPWRTMRKLEAKGYETYRLVGEFDRVHTRAKAERNYADDEAARRHVLILEGMPHSGMALQQKHIPVAIELATASQ